MMVLLAAMPCIMPNPVTSIINIESHMTWESPNRIRPAPKALAATKRLLWSGIGTSVEQCLPEEARTVSELSGTADAREGLAAVIERRKPTFTGR